MQFDNKELRQVYTGIQFCKNSVLSPDNLKITFESDKKKSSVDVTTFSFLDQIMGNYYFDGDKTLVYNSNIDNLNSKATKNFVVYTNSSHNTLFVYILEGLNITEK
jgi:hypothetical protein